MSRARDWQIDGDKPLPPCTNSRIADGAAAVLEHRATGRGPDGPCNTICLANRPTLGTAVGRLSRSGHPARKQARNASDGVTGTTPGDLWDEGTILGKSVMPLRSQT